MILLHIQQITTSDHLLLSAARLASGLGKSLGILIFADNSHSEKKIKEELQLKLSLLELKVDHIILQPENQQNLFEICETHEVSFLFIQLVRTSRKMIMQKLQACRKLRIPYLIFKNEFSEIDFSRIILPVNFLIEEIEKAQFAAAFGRYFGAEIVLLQAKDYGSKAAMNVSKISKVLDSFHLKFAIIQGVKDSFKIESEAIQRSANQTYGLIVASSSREYGLDDVVFGPKEMHLLKSTKVPLMLINPRADLYVLCD